MISYSQESFKDSVPDRYRTSNFPMFRLHSEGTSEGNNSTMVSSQTSQGDRNVASLEEKKLQNMISDVGRSKASVNKYRGRVPPLGKVKVRSLSPISKRRQFHNTLREQMVTQVLEGEPKNGVTKPKTTEIKKWKQVPLGTRRTRGSHPRKVEMDVAESQNIAGIARSPGAPYETKPFKLLPPIPPKVVEKKNKQTKDGHDQPNVKVKRGFIPVRHTKKSAQVEIRMKTKCDTDTAHVQSSVPRARQQFVNEVPGASGKKQISSISLDVTAKKESSACTAASDWSTTCIASTTPVHNESKLSIPSMSSLILTLKGQSGTPQATINKSASSHSEKSPLDVTAVEAVSTLEKEFEQCVKCETPVSGSEKTASETADTEPLCDQKSSDSSLPISMRSRQSRREEGSPTSSASKSPHRRKVARCVSKRSRRDRRSKSRSPSAFRVTENAKTSSIGSHRSGNERVRSTCSRRNSGLASSRSIPNISKGSQTPMSRSQLPCTSPTGLSEHSESSRSRKKSFSSSLSTSRDVSPTCSSRSKTNRSIRQSPRTGSRASGKSSCTTVISSSRGVSRRAKRDCGSRSRSSSRSTDSIRTISSMTSRTTTKISSRSPPGSRLEQRSVSQNLEGTHGKSSRRSTSKGSCAPCNQSRTETNVKNPARMVESESRLSQTKNFANSSSPQASRIIRRETKSAPRHDRSASSMNTKSQLASVSASFSGHKRLGVGNSDISSDKTNRPPSKQSMSSAVKISTTRPESVSPEKSFASARRLNEGSCPTQAVSKRRIKYARPVSNTSVKSCQSIEKLPLVSVTKSTTSGKSTASAFESHGRPVSSRIVVSSRCSASAPSKSPRCKTSTASLSSPSACSGSLAKRSVTRSSHTTPRSDIVQATLRSDIVQATPRSNTTPATPRSDTTPSTPRSDITPATSRSKITTATPVKLKRNPSSSYSSRSNLSAVA